MSQSRHKKGFGLIEVLLASMIIIMVTMALMYVGKMALSNMAKLEQRSQATFLAQEALEGIRQIRDSNYIDDNRATEWSTLVNLTRDVVPDTSYYLRFVNGRRSLISTAAFGKVLLGPEGSSIRYDVAIKFIPIAGSPNPVYNTNIMKNPPIRSNQAENDAVRQKKAFNVEVTASWVGGEVQMNELITDSRQGF